MRDNGLDVFADAARREGMGTVDDQGGVSERRFSKAAVPLLAALGVASVAVWSNLVGYSPALVPAGRADASACSLAFTCGRLVVALLFCVGARQLGDRAAHYAPVVAAFAMPCALVMALAVRQDVLDAGLLAAGCSFVVSACSLFLSTTLVVTLCRGASLRSSFLAVTAAVVVECALSVPLSACLGLEAQLAACTLAPLVAVTCLRATTACSRRGDAPASVGSGSRAVQVAPAVSAVREELPGFVTQGRPRIAVRVDRLSATLMMVQLALAMIVSSSLRALSPMGAWGLRREGFLGMTELDVAVLAGVCGIALVASLVAFVLAERLAVQARCAIALVFVIVGLQATASDLAAGGDTSWGLVALSCQAYCRILVWVSLITCMRQLSAPAFAVNGAACLFNVLGSWLVALAGGGGLPVMWLLYTLLGVTVASLALPAVAARMGAFAATPSSSGDFAEGRAGQRDGSDPSHIRVLHAFAQAQGLTAREEQVLGLLADGRKRGEVERLLGLSEGTVRTHINNLYKKLGVHSKAEAVSALTTWVEQSKQGAPVG